MSMLTNGIAMTQYLAIPNFRIGVSVNARVMAHCNIKDNPLSRADDSVKKGTIGRIEDVDTVNRIIFVEFNDSTIACDPEDIRYV